MRDDRVNINRSRLFSVGMICISISMTMCSLSLENSDPNRTKNGMEIPHKSEESLPLTFEDRYVMRAYAWLRSAPSSNATYLYPIPAGTRLSVKPASDDRNSGTYKDWFKIETPAAYIQQEELIKLFSSIPPNHAFYLRSFSVRASCASEGYQKDVRLVMRGGYARIKTVEQNAYTTVEVVQEGSYRLEADHILVTLAGAKGTKKEDGADMQNKTDLYHADPITYRLRWSFEGQGFVSDEQVALLKGGGYFINKSDCFVAEKKYKPFQNFEGYCSDDLNYDLVQRHTREPFITTGYFCLSK